MFSVALEGVSKSFGPNQVLKKVSWQISTQDKVGLIGVNASGKSTLLRVMAGTLKPDRGILQVASELRMGYLRQRPDHDESLSINDLVAEAFGDLIQLHRRMTTLEEEMSCASDEMEALLNEYSSVQEAFQRQGGYDYETRVEFFLTQLGIAELDRRRPISILSGGQRSRLYLACILMRQPDLLLLDEPDNHLDTTALEWLEGFLQGYRGAFVLVSHDRFLLDQVVTETVEIENGAITKYRGNYTAYRRKKEQQLTGQYYAYINQQQAINRLEKSILMLKKWSSSDSVKRARQAKSMQKQIDRMEPIEKPMLERKRMRLDLEVQKRSGDLVVEANHLTKRYGDQTIIEDVDFQIRWGDHVALIGENGSGKTTLLRLILGLETPTSGEIHFGEGLIVSYFDQDQAGIQPDRSIYDELQAETELTVNETRYLLVRLLFHRDDASKPVRALSGGERNRVILSKLIYSKANLLILDEPTNHLDASSVEVLEEALAEFPGTLLIVSHDRYLLSRVTNRVIAVADGKLKSYPFGFENYLRHREN